jgi:hypothetical protein
MVDCELSRARAALLYGVGQVIYDNPRENTRSTAEEIAGNHAHFTRKILAYYGLEKCSCIPRVKLFPDEIAEAKKIIGRIRNPVIFKDCANDNCGRSMSLELASHIVNSNPQKTFVNFTDSKTLALRKDAGQKVSGVIDLVDIPIRLVAACYYHIGKYVGCDTGNYHLMLSVGGKCDVLIPEHGENNYYYPIHLYPEDAFGNDENRINYIKRIAAVKKSIIGINY